MQSGWRSSQLSSFTRKDPGYSLTEPSLSWKMVVLSPSICILLNQGPGSPKNTRDVIYSRGMEWCRHSLDAAHICFYFVLLYVTDDYIQNAKAPKRSVLIQFLLSSRWKRSKTNWKQDNALFDRLFMTVSVEESSELFKSSCSLFFVFHAEVDSQVRGQRWCQWRYYWGSSATSYWAWSQRRWCVVLPAPCTSEMCSSACWWAHHRSACPG